MTAKQVFEYALVELNKKEAPSLLLEDYNYFINKAINQYINKMYNAYDINQQKTDDLRVLKSSATLVPTLSSDWSTSNLFDKTYVVDLPDDYLHTLNCIVEYDVLKNYKCYNLGSKWQQGAKRVTADILSQVIHNYYLRPSYKNPYFYINNVNISNTFPTSDNQVDILDNIYNKLIVFSTPNPNNGEYININGVIYTFKNTVVDPLYDVLIGTDYNATAVNLRILLGHSTNLYIQNLTTTIPVGQPANITISSVGSDFNLSTNSSKITVSTLTTTYVPNIEKVAEDRYGNKSKVRMEIRYGKDNATFQLSKVYIDYLKSPQFVRLTQDEVDEVDDISQMLEFPDYVCQEIVNELIKLLMENASDPRLQSHIPINQSIASPQQQQEAPKRK